MSKTIRLNIPFDEELPEQINSFSPEEILKCLKIGCECIVEARKFVAGMSQEEITKKIKNETKREIEKVELELMVEREMVKKLDEKYLNIYEGQIEQLKKQMDMMREKIKTYEYENKDFIKREVEKERERFDLLLQEKDKQNQINRELFDKTVKMLDKKQYTSSKDKGNEGEEQIEKYLEDTFKDFKGYKLLNTSKQAHKGDFHLFFDEFNVLIDTKKFGRSVQKKDVDKIESDLIANDNMTFAWLISLDTNISDWNRFPIMYKWITTEVGLKCVIYVNNLMEYKDIQNILRTLWNVCNEFMNLIKEENPDDIEIQKYKERDISLKEKIQSLQTRSNDMKRNINMSLSILKNMDNDLLELLSLMSNKIMNDECEKYNKINVWFENIIEYTENDNDKLVSTDLWTRFKKENKDYVVENKIVLEIFKETIIKIVGNNYIERTKKGAIELFGYRLKNKEDEKEIVIETEIKKPSKKIITKSTYYFDKELDNLILHDYNELDKNIITISKEKSIEPWQVVSLLIKYKIINKRDEANGYDIYKKTDEYIEKLKK